LVSWSVSQYVTRKSHILAVNFLADLGTPAFRPQMRRPDILADTTLGIYRRSHHDCRALRADYKSFIAIALASLIIFLPYRSIVQSKSPWRPWP
jgi:hypothetical protein